MTSELLATYSVYFKGEYYKIKKALENNINIPNENIPHKYITILDEEYPSSFRHLKEPPFVLFYEGNLALLKEKKVAVVGSREASDYALKYTKLLCQSLIDKYVVVSGLAKGIDACAHLNSKASIGILGCGLNYNYPVCNSNLIKYMKNKQLVISEYPLHVKPLAQHFPFRNRLIVALASQIYVTQCEIKSGTMTSVKLALEMGKDIYCLPYSLDNKEGIGCNQLISEGAYMLMNL